MKTYNHKTILREFTPDENAKKHFEHVDDDGELPKVGERLKIKGEQYENIEFIVLSVRELTKKEKVNRDDDVVAEIFVKFEKLETEDDD